MSHHGKNPPQQRVQPHLHFSKYFNCPGFPSEEQYIIKTIICSARKYCSKIHPPVLPFISTIIALVNTIFTFNDQRINFFNLKIKQS